MSGSPRSTLRTGFPGTRPTAGARDANEAPKREIAIALLERNDGALSVQVLQEFYVQATRRIRQDALPHWKSRRLMGFLIGTAQ